jgi:hypothetical protein
MRRLLDGHGLHQRRRREEVFTAHPPRTAQGCVLAVVSEAELVSRLRSQLPLLHHALQALDDGDTFRMVVAVLRLSLPNRASLPKTFCWRMP